MEKPMTAELDRRTLLKGATVGLAGAGVAGGTAIDAPEAEAQDKNALHDPNILTETVSFPSGGDTIRGFLARPKAPGKYGSVIVIPGIFGVTDQIRETTAQIAKEGMVGLALDFYSRKGGPPRTDDFSVLRTFVSENAPDRQIVADAQAAIDYLERQPYSNDRFGVTGFCMGGRITLLLAAHSPDIDAAAPFYGPVRAAGPANMAPLDVVSQIKAPVQGHYGATDRSPSPEDVKLFYDRLKETNPNAEAFIYEGAGHAFQDWTRPSYRPDAAGTAWSRTLLFFREHLQ